MTKKQTIYYAARMEAARKNRIFASRERAADLIHVSAEALMDYETGLTVPPCDVVACMCRIYALPDLRNAHMRTSCTMRTARYSALCRLPWTGASDRTKWRRHCMYGGRPWS